MPKPRTTASPFDAATFAGRLEGNGGGSKNADSAGRISRVPRLCEGAGVAAVAIGSVTSIELASVGKSAVLAAAVSAPFSFGGRGAGVTGGGAGAIAFSGTSLVELFDEALFVTGFFPFPRRTGLRSGLATLAG